MSTHTTPPAPPHAQPRSGGLQLPLAKWLTPCCLLLALAAGYFAGLHGFKSSVAHTDALRRASDQGAASQV